MNKNTMADLLETLRRLQEQALPIQLFNEEIYKIFADRIESLEQELINIEDGSNHEDLKSLSIVGEVTKLDFDLTLFLQTGRLDGQKRNVFEQETLMSGNEMKKQHVLGVYKQLVQVLKQMTSIDIDRLKQLKEQWDREKEKGIYSEVEAYAIEKELANAFIEYQIKTCSQEERLPREAKEEFCLPDIYAQEFKKRIAKLITGLPKGSAERVELENLFLNNDVDKLITSTAVWRAFTGIEPEIPLEVLIDKAAKELAKPIEEPVNPNNLPLDVNGPTRGNAVLIVYEKTLPDGTVQRKKKKL